MSKERTPAGGDRSEIIYLDAEGNPVDGREGAVEAEVREYKDGVIIARTYAEIGDQPRLPKWAPPGQALAEPQVVDFAKNTWDVYVNDNGIFKVAETVEELLSAVGLDRAPEREQRDFLTRLKTLPSWPPAPQALKDEAEAWLSGEETAT